MMKLYEVVLHRMVFTLLGVSILFLKAQAQQPAEQAEQAQAMDTTSTVVDSTGLQHAVGLPDQELVEAFFDGLIKAHLEQHNGAGATVAVVRGDSLVFAKGYGYADVENRKPVQAERTLFRIGSISKLFVWTAVMQLVEEGKIDLNADVNQYLKDFQIPPTYDQPVTMAHLMTHTPGFEDRVIGLFARDMSRLRPLGEILKEEFPARVHPPGEIASYSNHGAGIAAYIVEQISGMEWDEYVEQKILAPLGMDRTTFRQPVPEGLSSDVSKGYSYTEGAFKEEGFEFVPLAPVGSASSTAIDMARFIRAHLNLGQLGDVAILDTATARRMQLPLFRGGPGVNANAHGFYEMNQNGFRVIGHGGDTFYFHSLMALIPEQRVGMFVSFNAAGGGGAAMETYEAFMDQFFPAVDIPELRPDVAARERLERFVGSYRSVRYSHSSVAKIGATFMSLDVSVTDDGRLKTNWHETIYWVETGALSFREEHGLRRLAFKEDEDGDITHLILGDLPVMAFERIGFFERPGFHLMLAVLAIIIFLLALIGWPLATWTRRRHNVKLEGRAKVPAVARIIAWVASLIFILFLVIVAISMGDPYQIVYGLPPAMQFGLWLPRIALVLIVVALLLVVFVWISGRGQVGARLWYTLVVLTGAVFLWQLYHWNLLSLTI